MKKDYLKFLKVCVSLCIALTLSITTIAQVTHQVTVQNFEFSPSDLVINEGDIVEWTNVDGFHNVNGTFDTYPGNTESFGNDPGSAGWSYSFTFTTAGVNDYLCDIHPGGMIGSVTVVPAQVIHQVTVQNFEFIPADLVINEGDIVQWTNIDGFHNVDGTFETYPGNTESFGNDPGSAGWTYSYQFTTAGVNNYRCAIHPASMVASVTVVGALDCPELEANIGDSCDDNNPNTENDVITADCECVGTPVPADLNGSVTWNSNCADRDAIVIFYAPNTSTIAASYVATVNAAGDFSIPDVLVGTYDIIVNVPGYLNVGLADVVTIAGSNTEDFGSIVAGDVNNNNAINILDISLANNAFNTAVGNPDYILFADVNCSGTINILDISGINFGFGLGGATAP